VFKWVSNNWERVLFSCLGLIFLAFSVFYLKGRSVPESSASFAMGFLCFLFASVARFKRFKGLGFEAELWEDKQKEAAELIDRLKAIVAIYTREVVLSKVTQGRWEGGRDAWTENWKLFNELTKQHETLGQKIDFSDLKREMDTYFLFDITHRLMKVVERSMSDGAGIARQKVSEEFGNPVTDLEGHNNRQAQLREIKTQFEEPFEIGRRENLAEAVLTRARETQHALKQRFGVEISFDQTTLDKLAEVSSAYETRPVQVTDRLIALSNGD
jgi:hypothetical protein